MVGTTSQELARTIATVWPSINRSQGPSVGHGSFRMVMRSMGPATFVPINVAQFDLCQR